MHSNKIPKKALHNITAHTFSPLVEHYLQQGVQEFNIIPLFLGPSYTIECSLPRKFKDLTSGYSDTKFSIAPCLAGTGEVEPRLAGILCDHVSQILKKENLHKPNVVLVDHGSPRQSVTEVRNQVGERMRELLSQDVAEIYVSSMERRRGDKYAFNEPLLENVLRKIDDDRPVVVAHMFLLPGRHAGPDGDVAQICNGALRQRPNLKIYLSSLMGKHPLLLDILGERMGCFNRNLDPE